MCFYWPCQEILDADIPALEAACTLAIQRMELYSEDAKEALTLEKASKSTSSKDYVKDVSENKLPPTNVK